MKSVVLWLLSLLPVVGFCLDRQLRIATDFAKADSIALQYPNHSLADLDLLASRLTASLHSDEEKFRAIYKWVCDNISYDRGTYLENKRMRSKLANAALDQWNARTTLKMFRELIRHHRTVCTGYAWLVKELAARAGLTCMVVDGYGRNASSNIGGKGIPNHSWNAVRLNDKWYLCDATWSAGAFDASTGAFLPRFDDAYFLADPLLFIQNHYPLDPRWTLLKESPSLQWFLEAPLVYS
ncbi:MAG TPA: transglutaminase domain-containing protein, partial [Cyclobacteriaceae bacterium]|nr:transglutaminase domain-containing protein [Cyclobacteriaceae bacterium]